MMEPYSVETEQLMQRSHATLSEKDRRRYAAVEARKPGHGGVSYIVRVLSCDRKTIRAGMKELDRLPKEQPK